MHYEILEARKNKQPPVDANGPQGKRRLFLNYLGLKKFLFGTDIILGIFNHNFLSLVLSAEWIDFIDRMLI